MHMLSVSIHKTFFVHCSKPNCCWKKLEVAWRNVPRRSRPVCRINFLDVNLGDKSRLTCLRGWQWNLNIASWIQTSSVETRSSIRHCFQFSKKNLHKKISEETIHSQATKMPECDRILDDNIFHKLFQFLSFIKVKVFPPYQEKYLKDNFQEW
mgnify:CR=1 FL=1